MTANPADYEPQRSNNFEFVVTGLNNLIKAGMEEGDDGATISEDVAREAIRLSVKGGFVPAMTQNVISINRGNTTVKYAGKPSYDAGTIPFHDFIGKQTMEVLYAWRNLSFNVLTEKIGVAGDYKKTCYLMEYTPDFQLYRTWVLYGCWLSSIKEDDFSSDNDDKHLVSATIEYDRAMIDRSETIE